jgi:hypothetical protein
VKLRTRTFPVGDVPDKRRQFVLWDLLKVLDEPDHIWMLSNVSNSAEKSLSNYRWNSPPRGLGLDLHPEWCTIKVVRSNLIPHSAAIWWPLNPAMNAIVRIRDLKRDKCNFVLRGVNLGFVSVVIEQNS